MRSSHGLIECCSRNPLEVYFAACISLFVLRLGLTHLRFCNGVSSLSHQISRLLP